MYWSRRALYTPFPAGTCISVNEEVVHGIPGDRNSSGRRYSEHRHSY